MKDLTTTRLVGCLLLLLICGNAGAQQRATGSVEGGHFIAIDVCVDPLGRSLGAYQLDIIAPDGAVQLVGIEGGSHPAFHEPPFYDSAALNTGRVIIAAFSTGPQLPRSKTRVATLHLRLAGELEPDLQVRLEVATSADGSEIPVKVNLEGVGP